MPDKDKRFPGACRSYKTEKGERIHCQKTAKHPGQHRGFTKTYGREIRWGSTEIDKANAKDERKRMRQ